MKYSLGLIKSPFDERDFLLKTFLREAIELTEFDLTDKMTPERNQGQEGSCAGFATAVGVKEYQEQIDYNKFISLSPRYVYEEAKLISGHTDGTTLKACMQVLEKMGLCEERYWPYIAGDLGSRAPLADSNASKYKVKTYARVTDITELKQALIQFGATLIGVNVYKTMVNDKAENTGVVDDPSCWDRMNVLGGHALTACAYNDNSPHFKNDGHVKVKNSWGAYGDKGYLYLSYKYIKANMLDAFSCIDIEDPEPLTVASLSRDKKWWV